MNIGRFKFLSANKKTAIDIYIRINKYTNMIFVFSDYIDGKFHNDFKHDNVSINIRGMYYVRDILIKILKNINNEKIFKKEFDVKDSFKNKYLKIKPIKTKDKQTYIIFKFIDENQKEKAVALKVEEVKVIYEYLQSFLNNLPLIEIIGNLNVFNNVNTQNKNNKIDDLEIEEENETDIDLSDLETDIPEDEEDFEEINDIDSLEI